eukprot:SM000443S16310  [mRNA]  locus=s443:23:1614:+ [translate_table: standard]
MAMDPPTSRKQVTWSDGGSGDAAALPRSAFVAPPLLAVATPQGKAGSGGGGGGVGGGSRPPPASFAMLAVSASKPGGPLFPPGSAMKLNLPPLLAAGGAAGVAADALLLPENATPLSWRAHSTSASRMTGAGQGHERELLRPPLSGLKANRMPPPAVVSAAEYMERLDDFRRRKDASVVLDSGCPPSTPSLGALTSWRDSSIGVGAMLPPTGDARVLSQPRLVGGGGVSSIVRAAAGPQRVRTKTVRLAGAGRPPLSASDGAVGRPHSERDLRERGWQ